jgi:plastocyanin
VAFCALAGVTLFVSASPSFAAGTPEVTILVGDFYFCDPQYEDGVCETYIDPGDTVLWDFSPTGLIEFHTATDCGATCDNPTNTPLFDSGVQTNAGTYKFTFNSPGQYLYFCSFHPVTMRGVIYAGVTPTPTPSATPPPPVGGVSLQPALAPLPAQEPDRSGATPAIVGAAAGGALLLLGGCWYAARRVVR